MSDELVLINSDAKEILTDALSFHEEITGDKLPVGSEITFIYSTVAAALAAAKAEMNEVALGNYLKYAKGDRLDLKGDLFGIRGDRLPANKARTTIRCYISDIIDRDIIIPIGSRFSKDDLIFRNEKIGIIKSGTLFADIAVVSEKEGELAQILIGEIKTSIDRYDYYQKCENITPVVGGANIEDDERYRERIRLIPESFTTAGSEESYVFAVKKSSSLVTQVKINSPIPNVINIYVIGESIEKLSVEEKNKILSEVNSIKVRPLGDKVTVLDPTFRNYEIDVEYTTYDNSIMSKSILEDTLIKKLNLFTSNFEIGEDLNIQDIIKIFKDEGVKRVNLKSLEDIKISELEIAKCNSISLKYVLDEVE
ncbi:MAG: baseplate J/gp47 family protein [Fusobacteriaceae bacterium]